MSRLSIALTPILAACMAGALGAGPGWAQGAGPDASAFQRGEWGELGELADGAVLSIAQARYREGSVVTFALRTQYPAGETATTLDVIELDCATARFRRVSARETRRNGEMRESNEAGAFEAVPEGSVMGQIAAGLCGG